MPRPRLARAPKPVKAPQPPRSQPQPQPQPRVPAPAGAKVFFPNVPLTLVRAPPNMPPHQAVLRVAPSANKLDIAAHLSMLYGVRVTDIRTMIYQGKLKRDPANPMRKKRAPAYKKAIVTMEDDFVFPPPPKREDVRLSMPDGVTFGKGSGKRYRDRLLPLPEAVKAAKEAETKADAAGPQEDRRI